MNWFELITWYLFNEQEDELYISETTEQIIWRANENVND